jgi:hypothetical protein
MLSRICIASNAPKKCLLPHFFVIFAKIGPDDLLAGKEFFRFSLGNDASNFEDVSSVGDGQGDSGVLFYEQQGCTAVPQAANGGEDLANDYWGETHGWFVEKKKLGVGHEGPPDGEHLLFATAEGAGGLRTSFVEDGKESPNFLQSGLEGLFPFLSRERVGPEGQILEHGKRGKELPAFGNERDASGDNLVWVEGLDLPIKEEDSSFPRTKESGDGIQEGGFSGPVRSDEDDDLAGVDVEGDIAEDLKVSIRGSKILDLKHGGCPLQDRL